MPLRSISAALLFLTAAAQAQFTYTTDGRTVTITGYTGSGGAVTIPHRVYGLPVTSIGDGAFDDCTGLTSVTIPHGVTSIGGEAFWGCTSLTSVTIPHGVTSIEGWAFGNCTSLTSVEIPNSVTSIGDGAFVDCSTLASVTIQDGVTNIGVGTFVNCSSLTSVTIPKSVTTIEESAFSGCGLTSVAIPDGITSIGGWAFADCTGLSSVTIGNGVTSIEDWAFQYCPNLKEIYFQGNAPSADSSVFADDNNATAYYRWGTTGWAEFSANTGLPSMLWDQWVCVYRHQQQQPGHRGGSLHKPDQSAMVPR